MPDDEMIDGHQFLLGVVGESHVNRDGSQRQAIIARCRDGETVLLEPEPSNPHDKLAVRVVRTNGEQIGYLPRGHGLTGKIHAGRVSAVIEAVTGGTDSRPMRGVVLEIIVRD